MENEIQNDYKKRINQVFRYIDENLEKDLSLDSVAQIAFFSPFHFHRIFKAITQETLNEYITRRRIEKSASDLIHKSIGISEIVHKYGFNANSSFTRTFKKYYGVSPTKFRKQNPNKFSKIRQLESKNGQLYPGYEMYICNIENLINWIKMNAVIEVKETPELVVAGITHLGIKGIENTFERLIAWANSKHLMKDPEAKMGRIFYDSFKVTDANKVRMTTFLATTHAFESEGEIEKVTIDKGKCIVGRYEITPDEFEKSWTGLFIWMNENGYKKGSENPYEIYHNDFREHPEHKFIVDLYIPVE